MEAKERIYSTVDGKLVREGDPSGAFLRYAIGDAIDGDHTDEVRNLTARTGVTSAVYTDKDARAAARVMVADPTRENRAVAAHELADDPTAPVMMHDRLATELADEARERANTDRSLEDSDEVTSKRLYWNADRTDLLPEGHIDSAFLAYGVGDRIRRGDLDAYEAMDDDDDDNDDDKAKSESPSSETSTASTPAPAKSAPAKRASAPANK